MFKSGKLGNISLDDDGTWKDHLFLTFDIDWAHDDVIADTVDLVDQANVCATWFVTHDTPMLDRLRANPRYELGIHPNFNWLLSGDTRHGRNASEVVKRLLDIVPEARCVRSHSMTQSTGLLNIFSDAGLTHDANHFIPAFSGLALKPWLLWNGMTRIPYLWEDDVASYYTGLGLAQPSIHDVSNYSGLRVFDFHPIHIFLNTESMDLYERTRPIHQQPEKLLSHRNAGYGARRWLQDLLSLMVSQSSDTEVS